MTAPGVAARAARDRPRRLAKGERAARLALSLVPGLGPVGFGRLVQRFGSAARALRAGGAVAEASRTEEAARAYLAELRARGDEQVADEVEAATTRAGGRVLLDGDDDYPPALADLPARPPVLYVRGELDALEGPSVAIVGTRRPSGYGIATAEELADELARAGATVVSGLALGIDGVAHEAALAAGGRSVAVLPSAIDRIYPPRHRDLAERLVGGRGALISEIPPGRSIGRPDFARRNRLMAALATVVVVVEAPDRSGALLTAAAAQGLGRELYAVPGPIDAATSSGCNRLIADQQATLVTSPAALIHRLALRRGATDRPSVRLSPAEETLLRALLARSGAFEELVARTGLPTGAVAGALTLLEVRGLATSYGGATYHPTMAARRASGGGRGTAR